MDPSDRSGTSYGRHVVRSEVRSPHAVARRQGGDEAEALLDLWTTLTDRVESADAITFVAQAYE